MAASHVRVRGNKAAGNLTQADAPPRYSLSASGVVGTLHVGPHEPAEQVGWSRTHQASLCPSTLKFVVTRWTVLMMGVCWRLCVSRLWRPSPVTLILYFAYDQGPVISWSKQPFRSWVSLGLACVICWSTIPVWEVTCHLVVKRLVLKWFRNQVISGPSHLVLSTFRHLLILDSNHFITKTFHPHTPTPTPNDLSTKWPAPVWKTLVSGSSTIDKEML